MQLTLKSMRVLFRKFTKKPNVGMEQYCVKLVSVCDEFEKADSANTYVANFTSLLGPAMTELNTIGVSFYTQLNTICENFAEVDKQIADAIRA